QDVERAALPEDLLPQHALLLEAHALVRLDGRRVGDLDVQPDLAQAHLAEREPAQRADGLLAEPLAAAVLLADEDAERRRAVVPVDRSEAAVADVPVALRQADRKVQLGRVL